MTETEKDFLLSHHTWYQNNFTCEFGCAFWGYTLPWTYCDNIHTGGAYIVTWASWCFLFCLFISSTWVLCLIRLLTLEISFHKYYTSYHFLVDQCHLNIFLLHYMSWSVSSLYVWLAYPRSYNSYHTNNTFIFVVLETGQGFLNEVNLCVL